MPVFPTGKMPVLQRPRSYGQLVVLHRCDPDISPKIFRIPTPGGFTMNSVVKTAIERLHELSAKNHARKLVTVRFCRADVEVKIVVNVAKAKLNVSIEPSPLQSAPLCRIERCTEVKRHDGIGYGDPRVIARPAEFGFVL